jgi:hypothetical protein
LNTAIGSSPGSSAALKTIPTSIGSSLGSNDLGWFATQ